MNLHSRQANGGEAVKPSKAVDFIAAQDVAWSEDQSQGRESLPNVHEETQQNFFFSRMCASRDKNSVRLAPGDLFPQSFDAGGDF